MCKHLPFNLQKTTQALNYFAVRSGNEINKMKAIKLLYIADRYHLRKYGRPISNDEYFAMEYGPVPSGGKDIAEHSEFLGAIERNYVEEFLKRCSDYDFQSIKAVDQDVLSESDKEALGFAWETFNKFDQYQLAEITHTYPEWQKHKNQITGRNSRIRMDYEDFFDDPDIDEYFQMDKASKVQALSLLKEHSTIENLWD
jgi:uncharacterized phage-associated protein